MRSSTWPDRLARGLALFRGALLVFFAFVLMVAPEKAVPGSSSDPARQLGLMFASRTVLLGAALVALAARGKREALAWVLFGDAALQVFDAGLAVATGRHAVVILPLAIGAIEVWAGLTVLRGAKVRV